MINVFDSRTWTGLGGSGESVAVMDDRPDLKQRDTNTSAPTKAVQNLKPLKGAPIPDSPVDAMRDEAMKEYAELAEYVGIMPPDLGIEAFKNFLRSSGITVFQLADVVTYMDAKAAKESKEQSGWQWRPLRAKDDRVGLSFGTRATRGVSDRFSGNAGAIIPGSDYYDGPTIVSAAEQRDQWNSMRNQGFMRSGPEEFQDRRTAASSRPYDRTIPLHAVRKVAQIEKGFKGDVAFFVCDYQLAPAIQYPDPFLMAVVPNPQVRLGVGRFIIDFWDEPGFGIEHMVKTDL